MTNPNLKFEILYFDDCPSWKNVHELLNRVLGDYGITPEISFTRVETHEEAVKNEFVGSPTIRVNGQDLFPTGSDQYALGCRVYPTPQGFLGYPNEEMLQEKLTPILATTD